MHTRAVLHSTDAGAHVHATKGKSWSPLRVLWSESNDTHHVAIHNPVPVVTGGKVLVPLARAPHGPSHHNTTRCRAALQVVFNRNMRDVLTLRSPDGSGLRWATAPVDITLQLTDSFCSPSLFVFNGGLWRNGCSAAFMSGAGKFLSLGSKMGAFLAQFIATKHCHNIVLLGNIFT